MSEPIARPRPCILVVEDNANNMMLVVAVLARAGLASVQASSTEEARPLFETLTPDIMLMDIQLPGGDGLSLKRELKTNPTTPGIPIIALSAHAMQGDEVQALAAGCDACVAKPLDARTFAPFVTQFLPRAAEAVE